jgi:hypothetical protein
MRCGRAEFGADYQTVARASALGTVTLMLRFKILKELIAQAKKCVYVAKESIGWITQNDFYAVRLQYRRCRTPRGY